MTLTVNAGKIVRCDIILHLLKYKACPMSVVYTIFYKNKTGGKFDILKPIKIKATK